MENSMFIGKYSVKTKRGKQVNLPVQFRASLQEGAYITQGFDHNLLVLKSAAFSTLVAQIQSLNMADPLVRLLFRMLVARAMPVMPDEAGRLQIPEYLAAFAGLQDEAILVGQGEYIEIWAKGNWQIQESTLNDAESNSFRFKDLNISGYRQHS